MAERTIFHRILDGEIPVDKVYEDDEVLVFRDIHPKAPTHLLFIAKQEFVPSIADLTEETLHVPAMLIFKAKQLAERYNIDGYQLKFHVGRSGGQEVFYLHLHFLSQHPLEV